MNHGIAWGAVVALLVGYCIVRQRSSISHIRGPPSPSWIFGNMLQFRLPSSYGDYEFKWFKIYGPVYRLKGCFGQNHLVVSDLLACQHILKSPHFALSPTLDNQLRLAVGDGTMIRMRGKTHQRLRNGLNPGFTAAAARSFQPIFDNVAQTATETWGAPSNHTINSRQIIISEASGRAVQNTSLLIRSKAALGYSLDDLGEEYAVATDQTMVASSTQTAGHILANALGAGLPTWLLHAALHLPTKTFKAARKASHLAQSIGAQVVKEKHDLVQQGLNTDGDIFGILREDLHSNTERVPLTGEEIVDQTQTIMTAGQEHLLTIHHFLLSFLCAGQETTESLRAEINSSPGEAGQNGAYDQMPLLNAFIKETLRFYPAEAFTERMVVEDTVIPLSESITTSTGEQISEISVGKGQVVIVGIASYHRLESHWGADADKFRPSRWFEDTILNADAVGPYANLSVTPSASDICTVLIWRFAILEMQAVICELVGKFAFALPENDSVRVCMANTLQPVLSSGERGVLLRVSRLL
ncbi:cytochrome P450 [Mycena olivaceomarginata]|nr:cytochrome P450 [Mycena olivaceomarginata]